MKRNDKLSQVNPIRTEVNSNLQPQPFNCVSVLLISLLHLSPQVRFFFLPLFLPEKHLRYKSRQMYILCIWVHVICEFKLGKYLLWYSLTSLLALLYLISRLSDWLWASASRWLTTLHSVWASCQYLWKKKKNTTEHFPYVPAKVKI